MQKTSKNRKIKSYVAQKIFLLLCLVLSLSLFGNPSKDSIITQDALNITFNQQVLSQDLAKVYLALCFNSKSVELFRERTEIISIFDSQLLILNDYVLTEGIKEKIQKIRALWKEYKAVADWSIKAESVHEVLKRSETMLTASKSLYDAYQEYNHKNFPQHFYTAGAINQYTKLCNNNILLLQQIMLFYMAEKLKVDSPNFLYRLQDTEKEFVKGMSIFKNANTKQDVVVEEKIKMIEIYWKKIQVHLSNINTRENNWEYTTFYGNQIIENLKDINSIYLNFN